MTTERAPVQGARVCAWDVDKVPTTGVPCAESGGDGKYELTSLKPGRYVVRVSASGFAPGTWNGGRPVRVTGEQTIRGIDIVLNEGGANLEGAVIDATGGPVPGATVRVIPTLAPEDSAEAQTDGKGRFRVSVSNGPVVAMASAPGYAAGQSVSSAPNHDVSIVLVPGSSVSGTVVAAVDGQPVADVVVHALRIGGGVAELSSVSQGDGGFTIHGLEAGTYKIVGEGLHWNGGAAQALDVGVAVTVSDVKVTVSSAQSVAGQVVVRATGMPCDQGWVALLSPPDRNFNSGIAADGRVTFGGVVAGRYQTTVHCVDHVTLEGPSVVDVGKEDVSGLVWKVAPALGLILHVVDGAGQPAAGATVQVEFPPREGVPSPTTTATVDSKGRYEFSTGLRPGEYRITPGGTFRGQPVTVDLREGMGNVDVTLHLDTAASIVARVRTTAGEPVDGVSVFAKPLGGTTGDAGATAAAAADGPAGGGNSALQSALSLLDGTAFGFKGAPLGGGQYRIGPLEAGRYLVDVRDTINGPVAGSDRAAPVEVSSGQANVTIVLDRERSVRGRVVDAAGQPLPDVSVSALSVATRDLLAPWVKTGAATWSLGGGQRALTDIDGRFSLNGLAHGRFVVRIDPSATSGGVEREVSDGDDVTLTLPALGNGAAAATNDGRGSLGGAGAK